MQAIIGLALIIMAVFLVISVLMQSSKDHRLSGSIAGGAETFFGKTKGKTIDAFLNKLTTIVTIIFVILVVVLYVMQPQEPAADLGNIIAQQQNEEVALEQDAETETESDVDVPSEVTDDSQEQSDAAGDEATLDLSALTTESQSGVEENTAE